MPEPLELNAVLQGRRITSIEPGDTNGWMLINLETTCDELRMFLTMWVGGRKGESEDNHSATCSLHEGNWVAVVRDGRDPLMPMASALTCDN